MSIPASQIVQVNPRLLTPGGTDLEFNGLLLSTSGSIPSSQMVLPFPDPESVGAYFGLESQEYAAAQVYFLGYNNSFKKPRALYVARRNAEAAPAFIRGGALAGTPSQSLAALQAITSGTLSVQIGTGTATAQNLDFSAATSLSDVASIIQTAFGVTTPGTAAVLTGGEITLGGLSAVTDGAFDIEINGASQSVAGLDFSGMATLGEIATAVNAQLSGAGVTVTASATGLVITSTSQGAAATIGFATTPASGTDVSALLGLTEAAGATYAPGTDAVIPDNVPVVTYSSLFDAFTLTSQETGESAGADYATGTAADALNLTLAAGAVLSPGLDAMSEADNMQAILNLTRNFVCFTTVEQPDEATALAYAQWASAQGVEYLYLYWDNSPLLLQPNAQNTIAAALTEANVGATAGVYDSLLYAAMVMGTAASIDWERRNGVITFAFKSQDGLAANVVTGVNATNLKAQNMNFMGDYATRNDNFVFMYPGSMFGSWTWIDTYLNAVWLNNALQVAIMAGLNQTPRVPYNDEGYALVRAWCQDPINRALNSGIIDTGVTLSESQKAELKREAGRDITGELFTDGYVLQVEDASPATRQQRESPSCSLWYTYGGSIHRIDLASTAVV